MFWPSEDATGFSNHVDMQMERFELWSNLANNCKFDLFVVNVDVLASLGRFPNQQHVFARFWEFGNRWKAISRSWDVGCVLASRKFRGENSFGLKMQ